MVKNMKVLNISKVLNKHTYCTQGGVGQGGVGWGGAGWDGVRQGGVGWGGAGSGRVGWGGVGWGGAGWGGAGWGGVGVDKCLRTQKYSFNNLYVCMCVCACVCDCTFMSHRPHKLLHVVGSISTFGSM